MSEVIPSDVSVCPDFVEGCSSTRPYPGFQEVHYALEKCGVVVVVACAPGSRVSVVVADGLKGRFGVGEYTNLVGVPKRGEGSVNCDEFPARDCASFLSSSCIDVDGSGGGDVDHRRS